MHLPINVKFPNKIRKLQMGFNSAFKGLNLFVASYCVLESSYTYTVISRLTSDPANEFFG
jgi:hypothetical protein